MYPAFEKPFLTPYVPVDAITSRTPLTLTGEVVDRRALPDDHPFWDYSGNTDFGSVGGDRHGPAFRTASIFTTLASKKQSAARRATRQERREGRHLESTLSDGRDNVLTRHSRGRAGRGTLNYDELAGLEEIYLEDSYVREIFEEERFTSFKLLAALTPEHPQYEEPALREPHCFGRSRCKCRAAAVTMYYRMFMRHGTSDRNTMERRMITWFTPG
jgi:hypothetical protein